ncbi:hypothetical protein RIF29_26045 [Crotalaria pallida]|uniref:Uncharacterized protein n=1 Tax=Crotalaria pallida TaxID=3830 RepID=A0AAN9I1G8_CROPI
MVEEMSSNRTSSSSNIMIVIWKSHLAKTVYVKAKTQFFSSQLRRIKAINEGVKVSQHHKHDTAQCIAITTKPFILAKNPK